MSADQQRHGKVKESLALVTAELDTAKAELQTVKADLHDVTVMAVYANVVADNERSWASGTITREDYDAKKAFLEGPTYSLPSARLDRATEIMESKAQALQKP